MLLTILTSLLVTAHSQNVVNSDITQALRELDKTLYIYDEIVNLKETRIDSLRNSLTSKSDIKERYLGYAALFDEYIKWNPDSAYYYANLKMDLAIHADDPILINDAAMDIARRHIISGMYHEALAAMQNVNIRIAEDSGQNVELNNILYDIYHWLNLVTTDSRLRSIYQNRELSYLKLRTEHVTPDMTEYFVSQATSLINAGEIQSARQILEKRLNEDHLPYSDYALLNYWMARTYQANGDEEQAMCYYAASARYDFYQPVREYQSLIRIAQYCYKHGDIERAYRYIMRCHSDATLCDSKLRINQIAGILPEIINAYESQEQYRSRQLTLAVIGLSLAFILVAIVLLQLRKSYLHIRKANQIKDVYLGEFLSMFAQHINSLEKYRSNIRNISKQKDFDALQKELRSDKFIDGEWKVLMEKFDKTFLGLFPNFITDLNALLNQENQFNITTQKRGLTNELRIFALIRLGVTESARIAQFLRLSLPTVYNYRVKRRNCAIGRRKDFEAKIMKIGW